jgi:hypothetical protein
MSQGYKFAPITYGVSVITSIGTFILSRRSSSASHLRLGIGELYWVVLSCIELHWVVLSCIELYWVVLSCIELYWVVLSCIELYWVVLSCIELYWVVLSCIELYWVVLSFVVMWSQSRLHWVYGVYHQGDIYLMFCFGLLALIVCMWCIPVYIIYIYMYVYIQIRLL